MRGRSNISVVWNGSVKITMLSLNFEGICYVRSLRFTIKKFLKAKDLPLFLFQNSVSPDVALFLYRNTLREGLFLGLF